MVARSIFLWALLVLAASAQAQGVSTRWCDTILERQAIGASATVTSSAIPVGNKLDAGLGVHIEGLGATDTVTLTTYAIESTADGSADSVVGVPIELGVGSQRVISADENKFYPLSFPPSAEKLYIVVDTGPSAGATVKLVGCSQ